MTGRAPYTPPTDAELAARVLALSDADLVRAAELARGDESRRWARPALTRRANLLRQASTTELAEIARLGLRPYQRGECAGQPRPCPWLTCRHHLASLLVGSAVNSPEARAAARGAREEEVYAAALEALVERDFDGRATCALDVAREVEEGLDEPDGAAALATAIYHPRGFDLDEEHVELGTGEDETAAYEAIGRAVGCTRQAAEAAVKSALDRCRTGRRLVMLRDFAGR